MNRQNTADELEQMIDQAWTDLADKDDRTSPEEYPDMALITAEELREFMGRVAALRAAGGAEPVAWPTVPWWDGVQCGPKYIAECLEGYSKIRPGANRDLFTMAAAAKWIRLVIAKPTVAAHPAPAESVRKVLIKLAVAADHAIDMRFKSATEQDDAFAKLNIASDLAKTAISPTLAPLQQAAEKAAETSPIMQAASSAGETVAGWSDAKRDYAARVMGDDTFTGIDQDIGWLKMYASSMRAENWKGMRNAIENQIEGLTEEILAVQRAFEQTAADPTREDIEDALCEAFSNLDPEQQVHNGYALTGAEAILSKFDVRTKPRGGPALEGGASPCACLRSGGDPLGNCEECDPPLTAEPPAKTQGE